MNKIEVKLIGIFATCEPRCDCLGNLVVGHRDAFTHVVTSAYLEGHQRSSPPCTSWVALFGDVLAFDMPLPTI